MKIVPIIVSVLLVAGCSKNMGPSEDPLASAHDFFYLYAAAGEREPGRYCAFLSPEIREYLYNSAQINCFGKWQKEGDTELRTAEALVSKSSSNSRVAVASCSFLADRNLYVTQPPLFIRLQKKEGAWIVSQMPSYLSNKPNLAEQKAGEKAMLLLLQENPECRDRRGWGYDNFFSYETVIRQAPAN